MKKYIVFGCILTLLLSSVSRVVYAESTQKLGVTPTIKEVVGEPGHTTAFSLSISNVSDSPLPIRATASSFTLLQPLDETIDQSIFNASNWLSFDPADFILQPKQTRLVNVRAAIPANAEPGGHYATIYFQPLQPSNSTKRNTAYAAEKVGVLTLLVVKGAITYDTIVRDFSAPLFRSSTIDLRAALQNKGNIHSAPSGEVTIRNLFGRQVASLPISPSLLMPHTTREYAFTWRNWRQLGFFKATLRVRYGPNMNSERTKTVGFWLLPWWIIGTVVGLGISAWLALRTRGRWRRALRIFFGKTYKWRP